MALALNNITFQELEALDMDTEANVERFRTVVDHMLPIMQANQFYVIMRVTNNYDKRIVSYDSISTDPSYQFIVENRNMDGMVTDRMGGYEPGKVESRYSNLPHHALKEVLVAACNRWTKLDRLFR